MLNVGDGEIVLLDQLSPAPLKPLIYSHKPNY